MLEPGEVARETILEPGTEADAFCEDPNTEVDVFDVQKPSHWKLPFRVGT